MKSSITFSGSKYYVYILVYVDNILGMDKDPSKHMDTLRNNYTVKPSSIGEPKLYLGDDVKKFFILMVHIHGPWGPLVTPRPQ